MRKLWLVSLILASAASADPVCRTVSVSFKPVANLQIAAWIEDSQGNYVDTAFVTRLTGVFGLANRPGHHLLRSDTRYPYARRDMVLPVWAHKRNHPYGLVMMGGAGGNSMAHCMANGIAASECDDNTIAYHSYVSSEEPFYCSPRGGVTQKVNGMDVVTCASAFTGSKGAFADSPMVSYYPPRADLTAFVDGRDGPDAHNFAAVNDLTAISGATPAGMAVIDPIHWTPPADGSYVLKVEASLESDFNSAHNHPPQEDEHPEWYTSTTHNIFGQPSVVYAVPFTVSGSLDIETTSRYAGYGDWDGATGTLHAPDSTISDTPGSGAGRFLDTSDDQGSWRIKVESDPTCSMVTNPDMGTVNPTDGGVMPMCTSPDPPTGLAATPHASSVDLSFASSAGGMATARFDVRYSSAPINDENFLKAIPSSTAPPPPGAQGAKVTTMLQGLKPEQSYYVAVRALASCGAASKIVTMGVTTTKAQFVTLSGCFIATAAYGTPLAKQIDVLRRLRDQKLIKSQLGQMAVAAYYSLSPPIAAAISTDERLRSGARALVDPIVRITRAAELAAAKVK
jgi:hypothetical protein